MLIILGILLFGAILSFIIWFPWRDEWDWCDEPLIISIFTTFILLCFGPLLFIVPIEKSAYVGEEEYTYEIQYNEEKYCDIEEDGDIIVKLMDKNGNVSTATYYKDKIKFEEGNKASVLAKYNKYDWNERKATWLGLWGVIWEPNENPTSVIITLPPDEYNEVVAKMAEMDTENNKEESESDNKVDEEKEKEKVVDEAVQNENVESTDISCKNCQEIIDEGDKFCSNCGEKIIY